jgi:hypothetical protein
MAYIVRLMERHPASRPNERNSFCNDGLWLGHIDQHKTGCSEVEGSPGPSTAPSVCRQHFDVR